MYYSEVDFQIQKNVCNTIDCLFHFSRFYMLSGRVGTCVRATSSFGVLQK